jgi:hypothetical protein
MTALRSFAPWIAFAAASAVADWRLAAIVALAISLANAAGRRRDNADPDDLATAATVFFAALAIVSVADPGSSVQQYIPALAPAALCAGAGLSVLRGRPFTIPFAKRSTPPELWDQPRFYAANVAISMIWIVSFAVSALALGVIRATAPDATGLLIEAQILGFVVPMRCTALYRRRLRARYEIVAAA